MRIRKNAKLNLLFSTSTTTTTTSQGGGSSVPATISTHVCQLNQSPWDVIPFDYDPIQFEADDSGNNGSSACDSIGAVDSAASMMETELTEEKLKMQHMVLDDNRNKKAVTNSNRNGVKVARNACFCQGIDEKGLPCKNRVKNGHTPSLCGYHLSLLRSYNNAVKKAPHSSSSRRGTAKPRGGATKKAAAPSSSNPYEFYYYSGFGPLWGKRRGGDRNGEASKNSVGEDSNSMMVEMEMESEEVIEGSDVVVVAADDDNSNSNDNDNDNVLAVGSGKDFGVFDFVDDVDDDEDDDGNGGKKRMRKPVKERSLKSLM